MTKEEIQLKINTHTSNLLRHEGNILELQKQVTQAQAELDYERDQLVVCKEEIEKLRELDYQINGLSTRVL
jgi:chromosome segregation ATPase